MSLAVTPSSLQQAVELLAENPELRPVAGCTDLMVGSLESRQQLTGVLDLLAIPEIRGILASDDGVEIGATTTFTEIRRAAEIRERFPALAEAASVIGGWQIQNRATLGGNIANASPAGDSLPVLLVLDAVVVAVGPQGRREIPYRELHTGYRETSLHHDEIIGWIRLPNPPPGSVQRFRKVGTREAHAISKVVVALLARVTDGQIDELRLAAGSVAPTPLRLEAAEAAVRGATLGPESAQLAGRRAVEGARPIDDVRSTAAYRTAVLQRIVRRMILSLESQGSPAAK